MFTKDRQKTWSGKLQARRLAQSSAIRCMYNALLLCRLVSVMVYLIVSFIMYRPKYPFNWNIIPELHKHFKRCRILLQFYIVLWCRGKTLDSRTLGKITRYQSRDHWNHISTYCVYIVYFHMYCVYKYEYVTSLTFNFCVYKHKGIVRN